MVRLYAARELCHITAHYGSSAGPQLAASCNRQPPFLLKNSPSVCTPLDCTAIYTLAFRIGLGKIKMGNSFAKQTFIKDY